MVLKMKARHGTCDGETPRQVVQTRHLRCSSQQQEKNGKGDLQRDEMTVINQKDFDAPNKGQPIHSKTSSGKNSDPSHHPRLSLLMVRLSS